MTDLEFEHARRNMVEQQIRPWEVLDERVLEVQSTLPRELFVPERYQRLAYADTQIPIGHDQVMMEPRVEGRLLQALDVRPDDEVLEIGTGSGYLAACLAELGGRVLSVDIVDEFLAPAQQRHRRLGLHEITVESRDAARGLPDSEKRFDAIAVTGSLPVLHRGFHDSLRLGGRLFVIVGTAPVMEALLITRVGEREWTRESLFDTDIPALVNAETPSPFDF